MFLFSSPAITPPLERRGVFCLAPALTPPLKRLGAACSPLRSPFPCLPPAITPPLERQVGLLRLPPHLSVLFTHPSASGTLRSGVENDGAVFDHVQSARARNDNIANALDDYPITVPSPRSRSLSLPVAPPTARSAHGRSPLLATPHVLLLLWTTQLIVVAAPAQQTVPAAKNSLGLVSKESSDVMSLTHSRSTSTPAHATTRSRRPVGAAFVPSQASMASPS